MALQKGSQTARRYLVAQNSQSWVQQDSIEVMVAGSTIPLNTPGYAVYPDIIPGARERFARVGVAIRAMDVQGNTLYQISPPTEFVTLWPNPRGYTFPVVLRGYIQQMPPVMVFNPPFAYYDWPVPKAYRRSQELLTWISPTPENLTFPPLPFNQYDWPLPQRYRRSQELLTWTLAPFIPLYFPPAPFAYYDWPNPRGYPFPMILRFLGPQSATYIRLLASYGLLTDKRDDGGSLHDLLDDAGFLEDERSDGGSISDA